MSLGGSQTSQQSIPAWLQAPSERAIARGEDIANIGYVPQYGPTVAALRPMQTDAMQNASNAASAFGLQAPTDVMAGMPEAQTYAGGVQGYSANPIYNYMLEELQSNRPAQYDYLNSFFIDPVTGRPRVAPQGQPAAAAPQSAPQYGPNQFDPYRDGTAQPSAYSGFWDMFDGGGPGQSGDTFQGGGPISAAANLVASPVERDGGGGGGSK